MKSLKHYLKRAEREGWAIGQFGFYDEIMLKGIIKACCRLRSPAILGTSEKRARQFGLTKIVKIVNNYQKATGLPLFLNLDHGKNLSYIAKAIQSGYPAVHFDGSEFSLTKNIKQTNQVIKFARKFGVVVEGEVGVIGRALTEPQAALTFVKKAKIDTLAVSVGNLHGIRPSGQNPRLDLKRMEQIAKMVCPVPLVLHGGSGTSPTDIKKAIKLGFVKVNITAAITRAKTLIKVQKVVEDKIKLFGSQNKI